MNPPYHEPAPALHTGGAPMGLIVAITAALALAVFGGVVLANMLRGRGWLD